MNNTEIELYIGSRKRILIIVLTLILIILSLFLHATPLRAGMITSSVFILAYAFQSEWEFRKEVKKKVKDGQTISVPFDDERRPFLFEKLMVDSIAEEPYREVHREVIEIQEEKCPCIDYPMSLGHPASLSGVGFSTMRKSGESVPPSLIRRTVVPPSLTPPLRDETRMETSSNYK